MFYIDILQNTYLHLDQRRAVNYVWLYVRVCAIFLLFLQARSRI